MHKNILLKNHMGGGGGGGKKLPFPSPPPHIPNVTRKTFRKHRVYIPTTKT